MLLQYKTQEGGKKGIEKSQNSVTKEGIGWSNVWTHRPVCRLPNEKDGVNMLDKFLSNYKVLHQRRQYLSGNTMRGNTEVKYENR